MALTRSTIETPALVLDLDVLDRNIAVMAERARHWGVQLRPHAKTHKSVAIARRQVEAGAVGITCATIDEAEAMVAGGVPGVLVSSPLVTPGKIARLVRLLEKSPDIRVVADHPDNVAALSAAVGQRAEFGVVVDLDIGHHRTGAASPGAALELGKRIADAPGLRFAGIQGYAGHLQHVPDFTERRAAADEARALLSELAERLRGAGLAPGIITGAGTGTAAIDGGAGVFTELQVGSYVFMDAEYGEVALDPDGAASPFGVSLTAATSVVSLQADHATTDGGTKTFATNGPMPVILRGAPAGSRYEYQGDEHGRVDGSGFSALRLGDRIECAVSHCDPTVALHDRYVCVRGDAVVDVWPVDARGRRFADTT